MKRHLDAAAIAAAALCCFAFSPAEARRGADDPAGHERQCRGCDDAAGHAAEAGDDRGGKARGADDRGVDDRGGRGRGADDRGVNDRGRGGRGADG